MLQNDNQTEPTNKMLDLDTRKDNLTLMKKQYELKNSLLSDRVRTGQRLDQVEYNSIVRQQTDCKREIILIEEKLAEIKEKKRAIQKQVNNENIEAKSLRSETKDKLPVVYDLLTTLRDNYNHFAADSTRVSSTRIMASKFVKDINSVLNAIKNRQ